MNAGSGSRVYGAGEAGDGPCGHTRQCCPIAANDRRTGFVAVSDTLGGTESHQRPSYCDRLADGRHPTAEDSPEQTRPWQRADAPPRTWTLPPQGGAGARPDRPAPDAISAWFARRPRLSAILAGNHGLL